ncbi:MAG: endo alpha-1,4 polygalactosaminidase [Chloroflexota bacterium]
MRWLLAGTLLLVAALGCRLLAPEGSPGEATATPGAAPTRQPLATETSPGATPAPQASRTPDVGAMATPSQPPGRAGIWQPQPGLTWQWQLSDLPLDLSVEAAVYDIDLFENDAGVVQALHDQGRRVICYISMGSWEDWRPDAAQFPPEVLGRDYEGWEGEKWLDVRRIDLLAPILQARLDLCQAKGFDAVEPDNIDGYTNRTGFPLTYQDQITFNTWLAEQAHQRGLAIALKNDGDQVEDLLPLFDFAITEDCFADDWCEQVRAFTRAGKAVLAAEYTDTGVELGDFCDLAWEWGFSVILKDRDLDAFRQTCP